MYRAPSYPKENISFGIHNYNKYTYINCNIKVVIILLLSQDLNQNLKFSPNQIMGSTKFLQIYSLMQSYSCFHQKSKLSNLFLSVFFSMNSNELLPIINNQTKNNPPKYINKQLIKTHQTENKEQCQGEKE